MSAKTKFYWIMYHCIGVSGMASLLIWFVLQEYYKVSWMEPDLAMRTFETSMFGICFGWLAAGAYISIRAIRKL